ncbi:MAG: hypothetical protein ACRC76_12940 [Proteocatella sp.]
MSKVLSKSKTQHSAIVNFLNDLSGFEIERSVSILSKHPYFNKQINLGVDKGFTEFYEPILPSCDLSKNLSWSLGILRHHKERISAFQKLELQIEECLLLDNYEKAIEILDVIDQTCGISTWSLGVRGSVYKLSGDNDSHSKLLQDIIDNNKYSDFFKTISKYVVDRYDESSIHVSSADSLIKQLLRTLDDELSSFLIYKIAPKDYLSEYKIDYNSVIDYEKKMSIIDLYKAIIAFIESDIINYTFLPKYLSNAIDVLDYISTHPITHNAVKFYNQKETEVSFSFDAELIDLYTRGDYEKLVDEVCEAQGRIYNFSIFEVIVKSITRVGVNPFSGLMAKVSESISSIILKKEDFYSSYYSLLGICHAFSGVQWFQELQLFVTKESRFIDKKSNKRLELLVALNSREDTPRKIKYQTERVRKKYFDYLKSHCATSITADLFVALNDPNVVELFDEIVPKGVDPVRYNKYKAISLLNSGNKLESIPLLEDITRNSSIIDSYDGIYFLVKAYIETDNAEKAIELFVDNVINNKNNIFIFDVSRLASSASSLLMSSKSIDIPICLCIYSNYVDDEFDSSLRASFDHFLINNKLSKPLDLIDDDLGYDKIKVNYFLEYVCTPSNMKLSLLLENKDEINACRIEICNYLIENSISKDKLIEETKYITKEQVFKKAAAHVDQSRIHADTSVLKGNRSNRFKEVFERFLELKQQDYSKHEDEVALEKLAKLIPSLPGSVYDAASTLHLLNVSFNEKNRTFHRLLSMLRDEFTFGEKGLNSYLSTRIRHGVLPTDLRKSIQKENLWSAIDSETRMPTENKYWLNRFSDLNKNDKQKLSLCLSNFTSNFENTIDEINDSWLQIVSLDQDISNIKKGVNKSKALFNYSISFTETYFIQSLVKNEDFDDLVEVAIDWLWHRTDTNLIAIRHSIEEKAMEKFVVFFDELESEVQCVNLDEKDLETILNSIRRAKEALTSRLKSISSWFKRSTTGQVRSFDLPTAIDIASRSTNVSVEINGGLNRFLDGKYLSSFVDIFYILFENALSKSKLHRDELKVEVDIESINDDLEIIVKNNCLAVGVENEEKEKELNYYRNAYGNEELMRKASQQEGGTGIFKICNTIEKEFGFKHSNDFGYINPDLFQTRIVLNNALGYISHEDTNR